MYIHNKLTFVIGVNHKNAGCLVVPLNVSHEVGIVAELVEAVVAIVVRGEKSPRRSDQHHRREQPAHPEQKLPKNPGHPSSISAINSNLINYSRRWFFRYQICF